MKVKKKASNGGIAPLQAVVVERLENSDHPRDSIRTESEISSKSLEEMHGDNKNQFFKMNPADPDFFGELMKSKNIDNDSSSQK